jgi:protein tyrosine/serine phosphatase
MSLKRLHVALVLAAVTVTGCAADGSPTELDADITAADEAALKSQEPLPNFREVSPGLYRGGHPNAQGIRQLKDKGITVIVDLEVADIIEATPGVIAQELRDARDAGITVVRFPMSAFEPALSDRFDTQMTAALAELAKASPSNPTYVHCRHGQDRTGLVVGLHRVVNEHVPAAKAYEEMKSLGFHTYFIGLREYFERRTGVDVD